MALPVVTVYKNTRGAHACDNIVNVNDGSTVTFIVRTPDTGVLIGGESLNYEAGLGGSGNPTSVGYELTANKEYEFTVTPQVSSSSTGDTYTVFLYNSTAGTVSYEVLILTQKG